MDLRGKARRKVSKRAKERRVRVRGKNEGGGGGKNQGKTYPVEIPRFVRRQFEFYYRRVGLRASRDVVDRRSGTRKERENRFENFRNLKLQGALKRERKNAYDGG